MSNVKLLRDALSKRQASWSISPELADATLLSEVAQAHHLGSLPVSQSMATTHMPRVRPPVDAPVVPGLAQRRR